MPYFLASYGKRNMRCFYGSVARYIPLHFTSIMPCIISGVFRIISFLILFFLVTLPRNMNHPNFALPYFFTCSLCIASSMLAIASVILTSATRLHGGTISVHNYNQNCSHICTHTYIQIHMQLLTSRMWWPVLWYFWMKVKLMTQKVKQKKVNKVEEDDENL